MVRNIFVFTAALVLACGPGVPDDLELPHETSSSSTGVEGATTISEGESSTSTGLGSTSGTNETATTSTSSGTTTAESTTNGGDAPTTGDPNIYGCSPIYDAEGTVVGEKCCECDDTHPCPSGHCHEGVCKSLCGDAFCPAASYCEEIDDINFCVSVEGETLPLCP